MNPPKSPNDIVGGRSASKESGPKLLIDVRREGFLTGDQRITYLVGVVKENVESVPESEDVKVDSTPSGEGGIEEDEVFVTFVADNGGKNQFWRLGL